MTAALHTLGRCGVLRNSPDLGKTKILEQRMPNRTRTAQFLLPKSVTAARQTTLDANIYKLTDGFCWVDVEDGLNARDGAMLGFGLFLEPGRYELRRI
jgi:hypothetical protein